MPLPLPEVETEEEGVVGGVLLGEGEVAACAAGLQNIGEGCFPCPTGQYCQGGVAIFCPEGTWLNRTGAGNQSSCTPVPPNTLSVGTRNSVDVPAGFYLDEPRSGRPAFECSTNYKSACLGGEKYGEVSCAVGHTGLLCGRCSDQGYYRGRRKCLACADLSVGSADNTAIVLPVLAVVAILLICSYLKPPTMPAVLQKCQSSMDSSAFFGKMTRQLPQLVAIAGGVTKILLQYCQCISAIQRFPLIKWPELFYRFLEILDEVNIELFSTVPVECIAGRHLGFYLEMLATLMIPLLSCLSILGIVTMLTWFSRRLGRHDADESFCTTLRRDCYQPKVFKLMTWVMLFCYASLARKSLSIFDCVVAGEEHFSGKPIYLLRNDPALECFNAEWFAYAAIAGLVGVCFYCLGFPLLVLLMAWRYERSNKEDSDAFERVSVLVSTYEPKFWYCEALSLLHKLFFTGVIHLIKPGTRLQIWSGVLGCIVTYAIFILTFPFKYDICDWVQGAALTQLLLTYVSAFLFFDDGSAETESYRSDTLGVVLTLVNCLCFFVLVGFSWFEIIDERRKLARNQLRYQDTGLPAHAIRLQQEIRYHLFLSHVWSTGQDVMRIIKERLLEVLPGLEIFLGVYTSGSIEPMRIPRSLIYTLLPALISDVDVDGLEIGDLEKYIAASGCVMVMVSKGYFDSKNCMRELRSAVNEDKLIVALMDPDPSKGLTIEQAIEKLTIREIKLAGECCPDVASSGLHVGATASVMEWCVQKDDFVRAGDVLCYLVWSGEQLETATAGSPRKLRITSPHEGRVLSIPSRRTFTVGEVLLLLSDAEGEHLACALFRHEPIEWNRLGVFQDVSLRLVASRLLPQSFQMAISKAEAAVHAPPQFSAALVPVATGLSLADTICTQWSQSSFTDRVVYIANELSHQLRNVAVSQPHGQKRFHLYYSQDNQGAPEIVEEINAYLGSVKQDDRSSMMILADGMGTMAGTPIGSSQQQGSDGRIIMRAFHDFIKCFTRGDSRSSRFVMTSSVTEDMVDCEAMMVYLNANTWTGE